MEQPKSILLHLAQTEQQLLDLESHIEDLQAERTEWKSKYNKLYTKYNNADVDKTELEQLKIENGKLQAELNTTRRNRNTEGNLAMEKLKEIERVLKYKS